MQAVAEWNELTAAALPFGHFLKAGNLRERPIRTDLKAAKGPAELATLIEAIASHRDRDAFAALFDHFAPRIKAFLMRTTPAAGAEELAQEALLTVWRKADQFDRSRAGAAAWIFTIARNLRIDSARREQRGSAIEAATVEDIEQPQAPDTLMIAGEREQRVRAVLAQLSGDQMRVVRLSFFEGKPHAAIASELGIPIGTIKSRIRLAMDRLRKLLGDLT
jgi:RNA polymerase sigma-70 factor (ECF subfamily)